LVFLFKRKIVLDGPGHRYFRLTLPPEVVRALDIGKGRDVDLDLVSLVDGETVLIVSRGG
jgi:hypothetical protein